MVHFRQPLQDTAGNLLTDVTVSVYQPGTTTLITETLYSDAALTQTLANPFTATTGYAEFYMADSQVIRFGLQRPSTPQTYVDNVTVGNPIDDHDLSVALAQGEANAVLLGLFSPIAISAAGKTTITDADIPTGHSIRNGMAVAHYDESTSSAYLSLRINDTWFVMAGPVT